MSTLQGENKLLKDYIATLQKQNQARNQQRNTIFQQIDRLAAQNDRLNQLINKNKNRPSTTAASNTSALQHQLKNLKEAMINKLKTIDTLNVKVSEQNSEIMTKENQLTKLKAENASLLAQIKRIKDSQNKNSTQSNRILILQNQVNTYKVKIDQMENIQAQLRSANAKVIDFQNSRKKIQADNRNLQSQIRRLGDQNRKLQSSNRQITKNNCSLISSQSTSFTSAKLALQATIRQLNSKIEWQQNQNKSVEQQKNMIEKRLKDVERQFQETKSKLIHLKYVQESFKSVQSGISIKQKQMQALEQMILSLKENKKFLQKTLKEKQDIIVTLQGQIYSYKSSSFNNDNYLKEASSLKIQKLQIEKQYYQLKSHCEMLQLQVNKVKQREDSLVMQVSSLREQRETLLKERDIHAHHFDEKDRQISLMKQKFAEINHESLVYHERQQERNSYGPDRHSKLQNSTELKLLVEKLREQIDEMKSSYHFKPNFQQQSHRQHKYLMSPTNNVSMINLNKRDKSPTRGVHPKVVVNNERSKVDVNKQKWQNLQRKINALRNQNEYLKKSLFD